MKTTFPHPHGLTAEHRPEDLPYGRGSGQYKRGAPILTWDKLQGLVIVDSKRFPEPYPEGATNVIRIISADPTDMNRPMCQWAYVNPATGEVYGETHTLWTKEFYREIKQALYFQAVPRA